jgi:hypothetical protein
VNYAGSTRLVARQRALTPIVLVLFSFWSLSLLFVAVLVLRVAPYDRLLGIEKMILPRHKRLVRAPSRQPTATRHRDDAPGMSEGSCHR